MPDSQTRNALVTQRHRDAPLLDLVIHLLQPQTEIEAGSSCTVGFRVQRLAYVLADRKTAHVMRVRIGTRLLRFAHELMTARHLVQALQGLVLGCVGSEPEFVDDLDQSCRLGAFG